MVKIDAKMPDHPVPAASTEPKSSYTIADSEERDEAPVHKLRQLQTWKLIGTEANLTLQQSSGGRCDRCKKFAITCSTRITDDWPNRVYTVRCDECRSAHRPASGCNVDVTPVSERYPHLSLSRGTQGGSSTTAASSASSVKRKETLDRQQNEEEPSTLRKKASIHPSVKETASTGRTLVVTDGRCGTGSLSQREANLLVARTLLRQSILGIDGDKTNTSAVVRAFVPGLKSAYDLLFPNEPLHEKH